jgi:hypothetical protein
MKDGVAIGGSKARRECAGLVDLRAPLMSTPTALDAPWFLCVSEFLMVIYITFMDIKGY